MNEVDQLKAKLVSSSTTELLFKTSGTSGVQRTVVLSLEGFLAAARSVSCQLELTTQDVWGITLPLSHVSGASIVARGVVSGCATPWFSQKWEPKACYHFLQTESVSVISLVPTQLFDLVTLGLPAPASLRLVVVGGGGASQAVIDAARGLQYSVIETYGMTETSALAAVKDATGYRILPHLEVRSMADEILEFRGAAVLQGYLDDKDGLVDPKTSGWFRSSDKGRFLTPDIFSVLGRGDRIVKILGELVSLDEVEQLLAVHIPGKVAVVAAPDERRGYALKLFAETAPSLDALNRNLPGLFRIATVVTIDSMPLLDSGKIDYRQLNQR